MVKNKIVVDRIVGFTDLGNRDDFSTDVMEWRLARGGIINYDGDLNEMPDSEAPKKKSNLLKKDKKTIRETESDDDLSDD